MTKWMRDLSWGVSFTVVFTFLALGITACGGSSGGGSSSSGGSSSGSGSTTVLSISPQDNELYVSPDTTISITVDRDISSVVLNGSEFNIEANGNRVDGVVTKNTATNTFEFTPANPLELAGKYNVVINNLAGITSYNWSFTIREGIWTGPELVAQEGYDLNSDVSHDGTGFATWDSTRHADMQAYANVYTPGVGWGLPHRLYIHPTLSTCPVVDPSSCYYTGSTRVKAGSNGKAIVLFVSYEIDSSGNEAIRNLMASTYSPDAGWSSAVRLNTNKTVGGASAYTLSLTWDPDGNRALITWIEVGSGGQYIRKAALYDSTQGFSVSDIYVTTTPASADHYIEGAIFSNGDALAVWHESGVIRESRYNNGVWQASQVINTGPGVITNTLIRVASNADSARIIYPSRDAVTNENSLWSMKYTVDGGWGIPESIETTLSDTLGATLPSICMNSSGQAVAVWNVYGGIVGDVWGNTFNPGTGWGTEQKIENITATGALNGYHNCYITEHGNFGAIWMERNAANNGNLSSRVTLGSIDDGWGIPVKIHDDTSYRIGASKSRQMMVIYNAPITASVYSYRYE